MLYFECINYGLSSKNKQMIIKEHRPDHIEIRLEMGLLKKACM